MKHVILVLKIFKKKEKEKKKALESCLETTGTFGV